MNVYVCVLSYVFVFVILKSKESHRVSDSDPEK